MAKKAPRSASRRVAVGPDGILHSQGIMGEMEHADLMLRGRLMELFDWSSHDLFRLANLLLAYANNRDHVKLLERVERLEQASRRRGPHVARRPKTEAA